MPVAAEYDETEAVRVLIERGADVNAAATIDDLGIGGQILLFHAVTQFRDFALPTVRLLIEHDANLTIRARVPSAYDRPEGFLYRHGRAAHSKFLRFHSIRFD